MAYYLKIECDSGSCETPAQLAGLLFYGGDKVANLKISGVVDGVDVPLLIMALPPVVATRWEPGGTGAVALHKLAPKPLDE